MILACSADAALAAPVLEGAADGGIARASEGSLHGLYWLVAGLSEASPLIIAIDDLHWADQESVSFLRFLVVRVAGMRLALLLATGPLGRVLLPPVSWPIRRSRSSRLVP